MKKKEFTFKSIDTETKIHAMIWTPTNPKAVVQISHGITEHIGRYEELATYLCFNDIAVIGMDLLGHGKSVGDTKAYFGDWNTVVEDVHTLSILGHEAFVGIPYIMLGFSLGSFLVRTYACQYQDMDACILLGTGQKPKFILSLIHHLVAKEANKIGETHTNDFINKLSFGEYNKPFAPNNTDCDWLCADETALAQYINDPLCYKEITAGLFRELIAGMIYTCDQSHVKNMKQMPILLLSGKDDPVGDRTKGVIATKKTFEKIGENVEIEFFEGRHDILHETDKEKVFEAIVSFIKKVE